MKVILSTLMISALLVTAAHADKQKGKRGVNIDQIITTLQLEETKANSLKTLMETHRADRKALRKQGERNREQRQALRKQHRQALLEVLGYEKMYEFEEIMKQNRSKKRKHKKH